MPASVDIRVTPSLHPDNVKQIEGYGEATLPFLAETETAFSNAYISIASVWETRAVVEKNPGWNDEQKVIQVSKFADKKLDEITPKFDKARVTLEKQIKFLEGKLAEPVEAKASSHVSAEIWAYARALPDGGERHKFISDALEGEDDVTLGALLGAPPYLSGLTAEFQTNYLRRYHEHTSPEKAQRLKAIQGAKALIDERAGLIFAELEKAVGASPHKAAALRSAHEAATKALELT